MGVYSKIGTAGRRIKDIYLSPISIYRGGGVGAGGGGEGEGGGGEGGGGEALCGGGEGEGGEGEGDGSGPTPHVPAQQDVKLTSLPLNAILS